MAGPPYTTIDVVDLGGVRHHHDVAPGHTCISVGARPAPATIQARVGATLALSVHLLKDSVELSIQEYHHGSGEHVTVGIEVGVWYAVHTYVNERPVGPILVCVNAWDDPKHPIVLDRRNLASWRMRPPQSVLHQHAPAPEPPPPERPDFGELRSLIHGPATAQTWEQIRELPVEPDDFEASQRYLVAAADRWHAADRGLGVQEFPQGRPFWLSSVGWLDASRGPSVLGWSTPKLQGLICSDPNDIMLTHRGLTHLLLLGEHKPPDPNDAAKPLSIPHIPGLEELTILGLQGVDLEAWDGEESLRRLSLYHSTLTREISLPGLETLELLGTDHPTLTADAWRSSVPQGCELRETFPDFLLYLHGRGSMMGYGGGPKVEPLPEFDVFLHQARVTIGRGHDCDICITKRLMSRHHAEITRSGAQGLEITDHRASHGTWIAGRRVSQQPYAPGSWFHIVDNDFRVFLLPTPRSTPPLPKDLSPWLFGWDR